MADALISVLLEKLASIAYQQIEKEVRLVLDVKKEVAKVTSNLTAIQAVLKDAEKKQVMENTVRDWLDKLKNVSYEMDDVLDEWNTVILIQVDIQEKEGENAPKKKVCFSIPSHCFCSGQVNRIIHRRDIALKIKDLNGRFSEIAKERNMYEFQHTERTEQPQRHKTSSFVDITKTFGREKEIKSVVDMLLGKNSEEEIGPLVIPIVGMGGMGKTTLAQLAYNDVKAHFEKTIWVCVSDPFDEIKVAKAIIDGDGNPNSDELEAILQCMSKSIEGKKFLIVLDDVWTQWQQLKIPLQGGAKGSRILVTTRKEDVAIRMGARKSHMIHLEQLNEQSCWLLFYHIAFFDREEESDFFEPIGKEIVKKCKGLPLAAKSLGSLMHFKTEMKEWQDVLDSKIWELKEVEQDVFHPLLLSYYDLESAAKCCLLYCAIFPKDYEFRKDNLIELWMSQDYLNLERNQENEIVGQNHFNDLVRRSFFQDFVKDDDGNIIRVKMHDIVHDFVQFLTKKECYIVEVKDSRKGIELPGDMVRHLALIGALTYPFASSSSSSSLPPISFDNCKSLRTLVISHLRITTLEPDFILQLKCLRTLNLSDNFINKLPEEIGELIHLRFVDLSGNRTLVELPNTMCNLYNLQTLRLVRCSELEKLPKAIGKLINLKHLYLKDCHKLEDLPKGIGRLTSLRILDWKRVCGGEDNETFRLGDLSLLDKLQGSLSLQKLGNVAKASEAEKVQLWNKKGILSLELGFWNEDQEREGKIDFEILSALQPPANLERLTIHAYRGTMESPNWISNSLLHLKRLTLEDWSNCEFVPPLGKLPFLEHLRINRMHRVKKVGVEFLGIDKNGTTLKSSSCTILFPKLKQLIFSRMWGWQVWEGIGGSTDTEEHSEIRIMPCLSYLGIFNIDLLQALPDFLKKTQVENLELNEYPPFLKGVSLEDVQTKLSHFQNIKVDRDRFREGGLWIHSQTSKLVVTRDSLREVDWIHSDDETKETDEEDDEIVQE